MALRSQRSAELLMSIQPAPWVIVSPSLAPSHFLTCWQPASRRRKRRRKEKDKGEERGDILDKNESISECFFLLFLLSFFCFVFWLQKGARQRCAEKWETKAVDEEASFIPPLFFLFFPLSQELLRVREVPGELETNGGWHHDRTLHQSLQRLFGYLPRLRKNCYSFSYILLGSAGTLSASPDIKFVIGHVIRVCVCAHKRERKTKCNNFFSRTPTN